MKVGMVLSILILLSEFTYDWHFKKNSPPDVLLNEPKVLVPTLTPPQDWSNMVDIWMKTAHQYQLKLLKIDSKIDFGFSLLMQGHYQDFLKWVDRTALNLPQVHWQKIVIYHSHQQELHFLLQGGYYENH